VGIPSSTIPGVAARFGGASENGVIYIIRVPKNVPLKLNRVFGPGYEAEDEFVFLNDVPPGSIVQVIPANRIPAIMVDDATGLLVPFH
jgi:hypothetical protein